MGQCSQPVHPPQQSHPKVCHQSRRSGCRDYTFANRSRFHRVPAQHTVAWSSRWQGQPRSPADASPGTWGFPAPPSLPHSHSQGTPVPGWERSKEVMAFASFWLLLQPDLGEPTALGEKWLLNPCFSVPEDKEEASPSPTERVWRWGAAHLTRCPNKLFCLWPCGCEIQLFLNILTDGSMRRCGNGAARGTVNNQGSARGSLPLLTRRSFRAALGEAADSTGNEPVLPPGRWRQSTRHLWTSVRFRGL